MADQRNGYIELEGLDQLKRNLEQADKSVVEATMKGLSKVGMKIIADAQKNLRQNTSVVTGLLRASGHVMREGLNLVIGFFDTTNRNAGYALYVEFGRRAGKMPPPDELAAWAYKKYHLKDWRVARAMGWAYAKRIAREGTQPHAFFVPAINKNTKGANVGALITEEVAKILRNNTARMAMQAREIRNTPVTR